MSITPKRSSYPSRSAGFWLASTPIMEARLFHVIMRPAMGVTLATGAGMLLTTPGRGYVTQPWMLAKLALVGLLVPLQISLHRIMLALAAGRVSRSGEWYRRLSEVPTLLLVGITVLAVFKTAVSWAGLGVSVAVLGEALLVGIRVYARHGL